MKVDLSNFSGWVIYEKGEIVATYEKENYYKYYEQEEIKMLKQENKQLKEEKRKVSDYVKKHTDKLKTIRVPKIDFDYNKILEILGENDDSNKNGENIKFILDGCDISFVAEAPKDMTLEQLLKQCDRIEPNYCACGIISFLKYNEELKEEYQNPDTEIIFDYDDVRKVNENISCKILGENDENNRCN